MFDIVPACFDFGWLKLEQSAICLNFVSPLSIMDSEEVLYTEAMIKKGPKFLLELDDVNNVGACNKACYMAIGWLLNKTASETPDACVVLKQTLPNGSTKSWVVHHTEDPSLSFPWDHVRCE